MKAYQMSLDTAMIFYQLCEELKLNTERDRVSLLDLMAKEKKLQRVWETKRSKEKFIKDLAKHFNVVPIKNNAPSL